MNEEPVLSHRTGPGDKRSMNHIGAVPVAGRKQYRSEIQNGAGNMTDDIEILHTDTLIKEVYIFNQHRSDSIAVWHILCSEFCLLCFILFLKAGGKGGCCN